MEEMKNHMTPEQVIRILDHETGYILLDVRAQEEYDEEHIPGALLIPDNEIAGRAPSELPDKDQLILLYCRSGRRAMNARDELERMGYTNAWEFGGIMQWPYETE